MRNEDDPGVKRLQLLLEPLETCDVEVIGRLVEQQEVGVAAKGPGERSPRQLAAGEGLERPVEIGLGKPETAHDRGCAIAPGVAARMLEPGLRVRVAAESRLVVPAVRHLVLQVTKLPFGGDKVGRA